MIGILTIVLVQCINVAVTQETPCSSFPLLMDIYFDETSPAGSVIFVSNETNSTTQEWNVTETNPRVALMLVNQTYQLTLLSSVDLDVADVQTPCSSQLQFPQRISCINREPTDKPVTFHVRPVNEYDPEFTGNLDITITEESKMMPHFRYRLLDYFKDRDCPKEHIILNITKTNSETDASDYFMVNSSSGFLYQIKSFDYEDTEIQCRLGMSSFLTITAQDGVHQISRALEVTFIDVDDSPPVFVNAVCSTTCYTCPVPPLMATVNYTYMGTVITDPPAIKALDPDTNDSNITYQMEVHPAKYQNNVVFENGTFILLQSFSNVSGFGEDSDFTVTVILQAFGSNDQTSDNFTLTLDVIVPPTTTPQPTTTPTTTTTTSTTEVTTPTTTPTTKPTMAPTTPPPTTTSPSPDKADDSKVLLIVLPILGALALIIVIVIIVKVRNKQPQHKYNLKEKEGVNGMPVNGEMMETKSTEVDNPAFAGENATV